MSFVELILCSVALAMDAFAVAICYGIKMRGVINFKQTMLIAVFFGGFQALMPLIGWVLGSKFMFIIENFDHWVAFGLLVLIGVKTLIDAVKGGNDDEIKGEFSLKQLTLYAVATSIDALAVGVSFACLSVDIRFSVAVIGVITFMISLIGVVIGNKVGNKFKGKAEFVGGIILILIGLRILFEHIGIINF